MNKHLLFAAIALCVAGPAHAVNDCSINGESVNPDHGGMTAGKTGILKCKDADSGKLLREQELRDGKYIGIVRYYKNGQVEKEYSVNERGNRDGLAREWAIEADGRRTLVREETMSNGSNVGVTKTWWPGGQRRSLSWQSENKREQAAVEFRSEGQLSDLRCAKQPVFGTDYDDKAACGFAGKPSTVTLYGAKGQPEGRITFERGERRKVETLWDSGAVKSVRETGATEQVERSFAADGTQLREQRWARQPGLTADAPPRSIKVLDQEYHASGKLVEEKRWKPDDRAGALLLSESRWYLNGQPRERTEYSVDGDKTTRRVVRFHDNGQPEFEGSWIAGRNDYGQPAGTHKRFDDDGQLRQERVYDDKGRLTREREFDKGTVVRDDEVFEDGSRKSRSR